MVSSVVFTVYSVGVREALSVFKVRPQNPACFMSLNMNTVIGFRNGMSQNSIFISMRRVLHKSRKAEEVIT